MSYNKVLRFEGETSWIVAGRQEHSGEITRGVFRELDDGGAELSLELYSGHPSYEYTVAMQRVDNHFEGTWHSSNSSTEYESGDARCTFEIDSDQYRLQGTWNEGMNFQWVSDGEILD
jgi:hypothetical protein